MDIIVRSDGKASCIYAESIPVQSIGSLKISRASHVEPTDQGQWMVDLSPVEGPTVGPFNTRSVAISAEVDWLKQNWLTDKL